MFRAGPSPTAGLRLLAVVSKGCPEPEPVLRSGGLRGSNRLRIDPETGAAGISRFSEHRSRLTCCNCARQCVGRRAGKGHLSTPNNPPSLWRCVFGPVPYCGKGFLRPRSTLRPQTGMVGSIG